MSFIYLASPYSHPEASVRDERHRLACKKAAQYVTRGIPVFCPIAHTHHVADYMEESKRTDFDTWMKVDLPMVRFSSAVHVLCIDGWRSSRGVAREIEFANSCGIPVRQVFMDTEPQ